MPGRKQFRKQVLVPEGFVPKLVQMFGVSRITVSHALHFHSDSDRAKKSDRWPSRWAAVCLIQHNTAMKTEITIFSTMAAIGWVAVGLGHTHHLFFSAVPCTVLAAVGWSAWIRAKRRKARTKQPSYKTINNE